MWIQNRYGNVDPNRYGSVDPNRYGNVDPNRYGNVDPKQVWEGARWIAGFSLTSSGNLTLYMSCTVPLPPLRAATKVVA